MISRRSNQIQTHYIHPGATTNYRFMVVALWRDQDLNPWDLQSDTKGTKYAPKWVKIGHFGVLLGACLKFQRPLKYP